MRNQEAISGTPVVPPPPSHSGVQTCDESGIASDNANQDVNTGRATGGTSLPPVYATGRNRGLAIENDSNSSNVHSVREAALHGIYADYWRGFEWNFFIVLTPAQQYSAERLAREFNRYINRLRRITKGDARISWLRVIERKNGRYHIHALLWSDFPLAVRHLEMEWDRGHAYVRRYNPDLDGVAYVLKDLWREGGADSYDCSIELPPRVTDADRRDRENGQLCMPGYARPLSSRTSQKREPHPSHIGTATEQGCV